MRIARRHSSSGIGLAELSAPTWLHGHEALAGQRRRPAKDARCGRANASRRVPRKLHRQPSKSSRPAANPDLFVLLGKTLGRIHRVTATFEPRAGARRYSWYEETEFRRLAAYRGIIASSVIDRITALINALRGMPQQPGQYGLIHNDVYAENFLHARPRCRSHPFLKAPSRSNCVRICIQSPTVMPPPGTPADCRASKSSRFVAPCSMARFRCASAPSRRPENTIWPSLSSPDV